MTVRIGELDYSSDWDGARPRNVNISTLIPHERFSQLTLQNNLAIVKLAEKLAFDDERAGDVRPVCLPVDQTMRRKDWTGTTSYKVGWGATYPSQCLG